ncbi:MAG TPA: carboxypeptidase regulatory-like domain-containing protein [Anaeromyxobacteraceae bacterium]|nr:carboxypeptidase regulatory-like domain-containing protein [Anaeromyxobacteraceae bacterium]
MHPSRFDGHRAVLARPLASFGLGLALLLVLYSAGCSCSSSHGTPSPADGGPSPGSGVVNGMVVDISTGARLAGASVAGGGASATTDSSGSFTLTGLATGPVQLTVALQGYAPGYFNAQAGSNASAAIVNLKKQGTPQAYNPTAAATLSATTAAGPYAVTFAPGTLATSDTNLTVAVTPLDPTQELAALPGQLTTGGTTPTLLLPVTFAEFTILDSKGNRVNLSSGASAVVELPIPPSLRSTYPLGSKIHCYAYDPTAAAWADFVDGTVVTSSVDVTTPVLSASIRHFSWYGGAPEGSDCKLVFGYVKSALTGQPLANARVEATPGTVGYSDSNGFFDVESTAGGNANFTAYQTGYDVDGSLTGMKGAKYIEYGDAVGVALTGIGGQPFPCSSTPPSPPNPAPPPGDPSTLSLSVGLISKLDYEVVASLTPDGPSGAGSVIATLESGLLDPTTGNLTLPQPVDGAQITLTGPAGTATLTGLGNGTGFYSLDSSASFPLTAGATYTLKVDAQNNGVVQGGGTISAVGQLAWVNPTDGATLASNGLVAQWSDTGQAAGNPAYAPIYLVTLTSSNDLAYYLGSALQFTPHSDTSSTAPLAPGSYTGSLTGFSGPYNASGGSFVSTNNITGVGLTGQFYSFDSSPATTISFTLQ